LVGGAVEHLVVFLMRETMADESELWQHTDNVNVGDTLVPSMFT